MHFVHVVIVIIHCIIEFFNGPVVETKLATIQQRLEPVNCAARILR